MVFWTVLTAVCCYGLSEMQIEFTPRFFIDPSKYIYAYFELQDKYFDTGFSLTTYVDNRDLDYSSKET
jgi:hypothetical protein